MWYPQTRWFPTVLLPIVTAAALHAVAPETGRSQELLSAADVVALEAPAPDLIIPYGEAPLQYGHLRLPEGPGPHPVVLFIHGGCWLSAYTIGHVGSLEHGLAQEGYAVWSLEYRRVGDEGQGQHGHIQNRKKEKFTSLRCRALGRRTPRALGRQ